MFVNKKHGTTREVLANVESLNQQGVADQGISTRWVQVLKSTGRSVAMAVVAAVPKGEWRYSQGKPALQGAPALRLVKSGDWVFVDGMVRRSQHPVRPNERGTPGTGISRRVRVSSLTGALEATRRALVCAATIACLFGLWFGAGALASSRGTRVVPPAGAVATANGYRYVVRPGDTLWSIASAYEPASDPRPLVAELSNEIGNRPLEAGETLILPRHSS